MPDNKPACAAGKVGLRSCAKGKRRTELVETVKKNEGKKADTKRTISGGQRIPTGRHSRGKGG